MTWILIRIWIRIHFFPVRIQDPHPNQLILSTVENNQKSKIVPKNFFQIFSMNVRGKVSKIMRKIDL
jgi:hypothetical protein